MLTYLYKVTQDLLLAGLIFGILFSFLNKFYGKKGVISLFIGSGIGIVAAGVISYFKNTTKRFDMSIWNLRSYIAIMVIFLLFIILTIGPLRKLTKKPGEYISSILGGGLYAVVWFYTMPDFLAYPFNFDVADNNVFSTDFIYRFIGYVLAVILIYISGYAVYKMMSRYGETGNAVFMRIGLSLLAARHIGGLLNVMLTRNIIPRKSPVRSTFFNITKELLNHSDWFIYAGIILAVVAAVILFFRNIKVTEEYDNPAQHRKIRARMRSSRRWAAALAACCIVGVLNLTVVYALDNQEIVLSPVEECELRGDSLYISFEQVEDGHLHRFDYETPDGIRVRFIIIKKPNSMAYGVGLDACDICGETGYYERDGQVVCKLCDVVMNINTIGFKGGCNPIVIDYSVKDGYIIVPTSTLIEHQKEFK